MTQHALEEHPKPPDGLKPSARTVYCVLWYANGNELDVETLRERTGHPARTLRKAVEDLREHGLVGDRWQEEDPRLRVFELKHHE